MEASDSWGAVMAIDPGITGKVFALDVDRRGRTSQRRRSASIQLSNVEFVLGRKSDPHLATSSLDLVLMAYSYHEFSEPEAMMKAVNRALKRDGRLVIIEFRRRPSPQDKAERMSVNEIRAEIEPMGFELDRLLDLLPIQHALIFTKSPGRGSPLI